VPFLRSFRPGDEPALADICLRTGDAGSDATGILDDDDIWGRCSCCLRRASPELAVVVETDDGRVAGYAVATDDTDAFEEWFLSEWWPRFALAEAGRRARHATGLRAGVRLRRRPSAEPFASPSPRICTSICFPTFRGRGGGAG
jgi:hypothetical protein